MLCTLKGSEQVVRKSRNAVEGFARQTEDMGNHWEAIKNGFRFTLKGYG